VVPAAIERDSESRVTLINGRELTDVAEDILERLRLDSRVDGGGGQRGVESEKVSNVTGDMGSGHGSSTLGLGLPVVPC